MVVRSIFPEIKYPKDEKSIKHIITEYDKDLENNHISGKVKNSLGIIYIIVLAASFSIFNNEKVSLLLRSIYCIPTVSFTIYLALVSRKVRKNFIENKKIQYKMNIYYILFFYFFTSIIGFGIEVEDFVKWGNKECFLALIITLTTSILIMGYSIKVSPKKFMKRYRDASVNYKKASIIKKYILLIGPVAVVFIYILKPYYSLIILSYIVRIILPAVILYMIFCYMQYDKIQELKKQIGYYDK